MSETATQSALASSDRIRGADAFVTRRGADWRKLEQLLDVLDAQGPRGLSIRDAATLGKLYRAACSDLLTAQRELEEAVLSDYLNALVARAYARVYAGSRRTRIGIVALFLREFPALVRAERRLVALASALLLAGALFGAWVVMADPSAMGLVIPDMHQLRTPEERVRDEAIHGPGGASAAAAFSSFLFTHNIQVTFLVFALGMTFGIGTATVLFFNGVPLGALAAQYHASGQGLFFWAWILPHGVVELTVVIIAGAAGFVLARGLVRPGEKSRAAALALEAGRAVRLVLGGMPLLVLAGLIEGTISQMHEPVMPYAFKLTFAALLFAVTLAYLSRGGMERKRKRLSSSKMT
jgi:uncharacterized membrane protein SpoIIM required for sporulation